MKLYYNPLSTYSQKAMIAFNEKGLAYEPTVVNLMSDEERAAFLKVTPLGKVPFLRASDDWVVPESTTIIEYLEDKFPETPRLIPNEREAARQVRFIDRLADLYFNDAVTELLFQQFGFRAKSEERAARARRDIATTYHHWEIRLASRPWLCGEQFTMADCAGIPPLFYAQTLVPFAAHPHLADYWARAQKRPSYAKVKAEFEPIWNGVLASRQAA
jgi:glutathione S-transferase